MRVGNAMRVAERLLELRSEKKLTYQELESLTGISRSSLQRYETGAEIPFSRLEILVRAYGMTVIEFLEGMKES